MNRPSGFIAIVGLLSWFGLDWAAEPAPRTIPQAIASHPGNVFLSGEHVTVPVASDMTKPWRLLDYDDKPLAEFTAVDGKLHLEKLPVGWYRLRPTDAPATQWHSVGVIERLEAPTPTSSPIACDVAMAWFYPPEKMDAVASLSALAGLNWVRDRLSWGEMERQKGSFAAAGTRYDASAKAQSAAGLRGLQVNHSSPSWANRDHRRFPTDLRDAYRFYREMASRWRGQVTAFEPWNEADIDVFGGHMGSEIASLQKASYLGLKAGNPEGIVCQNVFATNRRAQLDDLHDNVAWPYFDTFNLHHYAGFESLPGIYAAFRSVSAGRPLWVTECALPVKWTGDEKLKEPADADLREQSERVAKTFATSVHEGSVATFYFLLPHYVEGQTQFGIIRPDLTPRPAYVALAAVGRLLADAKPLGRVTSANTAVRAFAFRARPDGQERTVVVAWAKDGEATLDVPAATPAVFDHLGRPASSPRAPNAGSADRPQPSAGQITLTKAPRFILFPMESKLPLEPPPAMPPRLDGRPIPVVLQFPAAGEKTVLDKSAVRISSKTAERLTVFAYNFSDQPVRGKLTLTGPVGWRTNFPADVELAPMDRKELPLEVDCSAGQSRMVETIRVGGDFGTVGRAVLSFRLMPEPFTPAVKAARPIDGANDAARWRPMISGNGPLKLTASDGGVLIEAEPAGPDRWVYPLYKLSESERAPPRASGLSLTFTLLAGTGQFRAIFDEEAGSSYVADFRAAPKAGETVEVVALFDGATFGHGWSRPDPNHRLDAQQIRSLKVGCNPTSKKVKYHVQNLRWLEF